MRLCNQNTQSSMRVSVYTLTNTWTALLRRPAPHPLKGMWSEAHSQIASVHLLAKRSFLAVFSYKKKTWDFQRLRNPPHSQSRDLYCTPPGVIANHMGPRCTYTCLSCKTGPVFKRNGAHLHSDLGTSSHRLLAAFMDNDATGCVNKA